MSKFLDKHKLKPQLMSYEYEGETHEFYAKTISYNVFRAINQPLDPEIRALVIVKYCLVNEEDGSMVFDEDCDIEEIGDSLPYEVIVQIADKIAEETNIASRMKGIKKKHNP
ncbi:TPA: hypothetical protein ACUNCG_000423 [Aeromonas hydrophila]